MVVRVPMRVDYGVRALVELASSYGERTVQTAEIAGKQGIPEAYLDQLLTVMQKSGFIKSRRGPLGGHALAKHPADISLAMVMASLDPNAPALECLTDPDECSLSHSCAQRDVWKFLDDAIQDLLGETSVAELVERQMQLAGKGV